MLTNLEIFADNISAIQENDFGDFMRTANSYLVELRNELHFYDDEAIERKLGEMQTYLQFTPNWRIEATRDRLLQDIKYIDELLVAHKQDWESAPFAGDFDNMPNFH